MKSSLITTTILLAMLGGCASTNQHVLDSGDQTQLQKRSYQSRVFDTSDKERVLRAVISTLQDLGFVIDRADSMLGSVSASKLQGVDAIRITVSVRPKGSDRMTVRANAQFDVQPVEDPKQYQDFFSSLSKSLFLAANADE
jgi:hypothetical protein